MYIYIFKYLYTHTHIYIYIYINMYIYIYIYIFIYMYINSCLYISSMKKKYFERPFEWVSINGGKLKMEPSSRTSAN